MATNFIDIEFPRKLGVNSEISEEYSTNIATNNFFEKRNSKTTFSRLSADISYAVRSIDDVNEIREMHDQAKGARYSFRFLNPLNYTTNSRTKQPTPLDSKVIEYRNGDRNNIEEVKLIDKNGKRIQLPYFNTLMITFYNKTTDTILDCYVEDEQYDDVENRNYINSIIGINPRRMSIISNDGYIDYQNGIYFTDRFRNLGFGVSQDDIIEIYIGCEFFNKMRFQQDRLSVRATGNSTFQISELTMIEVFE